MIQVTRKDSRESAENLLRRFTRKVQQSGLVASVKHGQYFEREKSKRERRVRAIKRQEQRAQKLKRLKLGQK
jgi:ribosomal protein S21